MYRYIHIYTYIYRKRHTYTEREERPIVRTRQEFVGILKKKKKYSIAHSELHHSHLLTYFQSLLSQAGSIIMLRLSNLTLLF